MDLGKKTKLDRFKIKNTRNKGDGDQYSTKGFSIYASVESEEGPWNLLMDGQLDDPVGLVSIEGNCVNNYKETRMSYKNTIFGNNLSTFELARST